MGPSVQDFAARRLEELRLSYPGWDIWVVRQFVGGTCWCAMPKGADTAVINVYSPEELVEAIAEQEGA